MTIDQRVITIKNQKNSHDRNNLISEYKPFIISKITKVTNKYVKSESDEVFIVGLEAFDEAITKYNQDKGHFLSFASLVIHSRITDWLRSESRRNERQVALNDDLKDNHADIERTYLMKEEIFEYKKQLALFGITFSDLVEKAPKKDMTRRKINMIGKRASDNDGIVRSMYTSFVLPMKKIIDLTQVTKRVLKTHRDYIISIIIVYVKQFDLISEYILIEKER